MLRSRVFTIYFRSWSRSFPQRAYHLSPLAIQPLAFTSRMKPPFKIPQLTATELLGSYLE